MLLVATCFFLFLRWNAKSIYAPRRWHTYRAPVRGTRRKVRPRCSSSIQLWARPMPFSRSKMRGDSHHEACTKWIYLLLPLSHSLLLRLSSWFHWGNGAPLFSFSASAAPPFRPFTEPALLPNHCLSPALINISHRFNFSSHFSPHVYREWLDAFSLQTLMGECEKKGNHTSQKKSWGVGPFTHM